MDSQRTRDAMTANDGSMSIGDQLTGISAGPPKFDMRLGPDANGTALAIYRQSMQLIYSIELAPAAAARFFFGGVTYQLPTAVFSDLASVAQTLSRGPAEIALRGDQFLIFAQIEGELDANYAGREQKVRPGDVVMIDYSREILCHATDFRMRFVMVSRDRVPPLLLAPSAHGTVLPAASGPARLLYRTIETLLETADALTLAAADAAVDALMTMATGILESVLPQESGPGASTEPQLEVALKFIDRHVADPELSPAFLEAKLPFSRSSLYRMFEPLGGVASAILQRRLERSMKALLTGGAAKPRLRAIARDHGYPTQQQFSRAFRARFGITPNQFYELVRRQDHAGLAAQAQRVGFAHHNFWIEYVASLDAQRVA
jgi:AraC-like DNA-binding protein